MHCQLKHQISSRHQHPRRRGRGVLERVGAAPCILGLVLIPSNSEHHTRAGGKGPLPIHHERQPNRAFRQTHEMNLRRHPMGSVTHRHTAPPRLALVSGSGWGYWGGGGGVRVWPYTRLPAVHYNLLHPNYNLPQSSLSASTDSHASVIVLQHDASLKQNRALCALALGLTSFASQQTCFYAYP